MIKTVVNAKPKPPSTYPRLMISKESHYVVLFTCENTGVVLVDPEHFYQIGYYSDKWAERAFADYDEASITITNGD